MGYVCTSIRGTEYLIIVQDRRQIESVGKSRHGSEGESLLYGKKGT